MKGVASIGFGIGETIVGVAMGELIVSVGVGCGVAVLTVGVAPCLSQATSRNAIVSVKVSRRG